MTTKDTKFHEGLLGFLRETSWPLWLMNLSSEGRRPLGCHAKRALESNACRSQRPFIEQASDQSDSMRHAPRSRKARQWMCRVRSPIAARLLHLHESSTQGQ